MKTAFLLVLLLFGSVFAQTNFQVSTKADVYIGKESLDSVSIAKQNGLVFTCKETDGGFDLFEKGVTLRYEGENQVSSSKTDYCTDSSTVVEYWCSEDSQINSKTFSCTQGYSCKEGSCVKDEVKEEPQTKTEAASVYESLYCTDSDSIDIAKKGTVEGVYIKNGEKVKVENSDYCLDSSTVVEYFCAANTESKVTKTCADGYSCSNGACIASDSSVKEEKKTGESAPNLKHRIDVFSMMGDKLDLSYDMFLNKPFTARMINAKTGEVIAESTAKFTYDGQDNYNYYPNVLFAAFDLPDGVPVYFESNYESLKFGGNEETLYSCASYYVIRSGETVEAYVDGELRYYLTNSGSGSYNTLLYKKSLCDGTSSSTKDYAKDVKKEEYVNKDSSTQEVPIPPSLSSQNTFVLSVSKGWNLKSIPYPKATLLKSTCDAVSAFRYSNGYEKFDLGVGSTVSLLDMGFWLKSDSDCQLTFDVDGKPNQFQSNMNSGWVILGSTQGSISFSDVRGSCTSSSGPWAFENGKWVRSNTLSEGNGYFVKFDSSCKLGSESDSLPPLPN